MGCFNRNVVNPDVKHFCYTVAVPLRTGSRVFQTHPCQLDFSLHQLLLSTFSPFCYSTTTVTLLNSHRGRVWWGGRLKITKLPQGSLWCKQKIRRFLVYMYLHFIFLQTLSSLLHCHTLEEVQLSGRDVFSLKELVLNKSSQVNEYYN